MAFDLVVGTSNKINVSSVIVGGIEFNELPSISRLAVLTQLHPEERGMLNKLVAALSYAKWKQHSLYEVAD
jgi:hypothetical protein